jgi:hypothetical protein
LISRRRRGLEGRERDLAGMKTTCGDSKSIAGKRALAEPREKEGKEERRKRRERYAEVMKPAITYLWGSHVRLRLL